MLAVSLVLLACSLSSNDAYACGQTQVLKRPYGTIELRVDCDYKSLNLIGVTEYKRGTDIQHGFQMDYDTLWRRRDSLFFVNGKKNGLSLFWDTSGNVIGRKSYKLGKRVGREESFWSPGQPSILKNYNDKGEEEGPWKEWWRNGNKRAEYTTKNGYILSGTEYYPDGKLRKRFVCKYNPNRKSFLDVEHIQAEAWTPNGLPTGKIVNGNGEWTHFSAEPDSLNGRYLAFREVYKDSLMVNLEELDSVGVAKWLKESAVPKQVPPNVGN